MSGSYLSGVKIIGGKWRGRKLRVIPKVGLRPSSSRTRETLFNWLNPYIRGANCLDAFAGSGALAFESLSRGASWVTMIDEDQDAVDDLKRKSIELDADHCDVIRSETKAWLAEKPKRKYDIVYLDPPFRENLLEGVLVELSNGWLSRSALVYVERESGGIDPGGDWRLEKTAKTKNVNYALLAKI